MYQNAKQVVQTTHGEVQTLKRLLAARGNITVGNIQGGIAEWEERMETLFPVRKRAL